MGSTHPKGWVEGSRAVLGACSSSRPGRVSQLSSLEPRPFSSPESDVHDADHSPSLHSELGPSDTHTHTHRRKSTHALASS